jgi:hypothetical protein
MATWAISANGEVPDEIAEQAEGELLDKLRAALVGSNAGTVEFVFAGSTHHETFRPNVEVEAAEEDTAT